MDAPAPKAMTAGSRPGPRRETLRVAHLAVAALLAVFVYSPLVDESAAQWVVRLVVVPLTVVSGIVMWQLPRLRRVRRARGQAVGGSS